MPRPKRKKDEEENELDQAAKDAIDAVFSDTSVSQYRTISRLKDLEISIGHKIMCIRMDLNRQERENGAELNLKKTGG